MGVEHVLVDRLSSAALTMLSENDAAIFFTSTSVSNFAISQSCGGRSPPRHPFSFRPSSVRQSILKLCQRRLGDHDVQATPGPAAELSPDGRWVAYVSAALGEYRRLRSVCSRTGWSRNWRDLVFLGPDERIRVLSYTAHGSSFFPGTPRLWARIRVADLRVNASYDLAPDGKHIAAVLSADLGQPNSPARLNVIVYFSVSGGGSSNTRVIIEVRLCGSFPDLGNTRFVSPACVSVPKTMVAPKMRWNEATSRGHWEPTCWTPNVSSISAALLKVNSEPSRGTCHD